MKQAFKMSKEAREAGARRKKAWRERERAKKAGGVVASGKKPKVISLEQAMSSAPVPRTKSPTPQPEPILVDTSAHEPLPAVDIPTDATTGESAPTNDATEGSSVTDASQTSSEQSSTETTSNTDEKKEDQKESKQTKKVKAEKLALMGAAGWCEMLKKGNEYAEKMGTLPLPDFLIQANFESMHLILTDALANSEVDEEKYAAYVCVGSAGWVAGNCYYGYAKAEAEKKKAAKERGPIINGQSATIRSEAAPAGSAGEPFGGNGANRVGSSIARIEKPVTAGRYV